MSENKQSFPGVYVKDEDEFKNELGRFRYLRNGPDGTIVGMEVALPHTTQADFPCCGGAVMFSNWSGEGAKWNWNGNLEKPTLTPSIWRKGHWHGFLTDGEFKSC